jgi:alkylation response protein AidB-like acyl-CoA dehydrogenase
MVQFTLSDHQRAVRAGAADAAKTILTDAYSDYSRFSDQLTRFRATRPYYAKLVQGGWLKAMIPTSSGGSCQKWLETGLVLEELYAVDASISIHMIGTALGLLPLLLGGTAEQKEKFLKPFISGEGDPLASLTHSEPGGTANHLEKGGKGLGVTARKQDDYYVVNGEKVSDDY